MSEPEERAARPRRRARNGPADYQRWLEENPLLLARLKAGLTQRTLASMARLSDVAVRSLEQGSWRSSDAFGRLEGAVGVPAGRLARQFAAWLKRRP
jgi:hypothetical protein